ncbi:bifunctional phosphopantothenoylcysteine decarboxylase/phosphopantothenate--cysteine ligase CoaBC [Sulfurimonas sp.]|jgi:phosphopantothenoylcysteine decarboxylase/phosphopantothenate--cysteine ligase|uniref:bifunctional phosphopantothenoylcysteine decarboxylase/phosphopantothenate--cysteine ligase CoaBC n=1 Tax=Sulfurimonas sp. TaxID=2022749 RepID=UPI0025F593AF|nr:bifunctional phosphopantothenoylcysteine decarboxylase/phosphopantothenate--cysteine ligase CoaBC [Sulfurimonas sp.]MCK9472362.1 bifunctional phosphopantothenoylcysteine decarboxylase/phosphopantothenate--cysteine ligase CoaBC [Sulfurimonas sp.]MDD3505152.1 bifunctional phosphopantothenoylcysteine decarboxylase/phosphopantothenate--cysteine ligase CoaBC [Sulfurimonas sp.]
MLVSPDLLKNKKILLGVTGSIAAYKALELVRLLSKAGAQVKVIMSEAAKKFVTPLSFEALTSNRVLDDINESWVTSHNHIKAGEWADLLVIAPATANTVAKLANAIADNMLLQTALAYPHLKIIAPSANTNMINNPITKGNLKMLSIANYEIVDTQTKELACKTVGDGAMAEPQEIFWHCAKALLKEEFWTDRRVIVTGGGTVEKIDEVRYISNFSSGKMASALATALYCKGADVNLISSKFDKDLPLELYTIDTQSSAEMLEYLKDSVRIAKKAKLSKATLMKEEQIHLIQKKPYLFMVAAVSDYVAAYPQDAKLKKEHLGDTWDLKLKQNIDILSEIDKTDIVTIGFKAEMDEENAAANALKMIEDKGVDAVCLNVLKNSSSFGTDTNEIEFILPNKREFIAKSDKLSVSFEILEHAKNI